MNYSGRSSTEYSLPIPQVILPPDNDDWAEAGAALTSFVQQTLLPAHASSQIDNFWFHPPGSIPADEGGPSFSPMYYPTFWNNTPSTTSIGFSVSSLPDFSGFPTGVTQEMGSYIQDTANSTQHSDPYLPQHNAQQTVPVTMSLTLTNVQPQPEHIELWHLLRRDAVILDGPRIFIPQQIYQPSTEGDMERYVSRAILCPPIIFRAQGSPEWGIPILQLLSKPPVRLVDGHEPAFNLRGPSIFIRVHWPGYRPFCKRIQTRDYTFEHRVINKAKLAKDVAKCVKQYIDSMNTQTGLDAQWRVGPSGIKADEVVFVSLHHVSQGTWQPQLRLTRSLNHGTTPSQA